MRRKYAYFACLALFMASVPLHGDPLWDKAVEMVRRAMQWVPGTTIMRADVFDDKGASTDVMETVFTTVPDAAGKPVTGVKNAVHNGKDVTASQREALEKSSREGGKNGGGMSFSAEDNPFNPDSQASVIAVRKDEAVTADGIPCALYEFTLKRKNGGAMEGVAALHRETGAPIEVKYTVKPLPAFMGSMKTTLKYSVGPMDAGFIKEAIIEGDGGFLFIKRVFHSTITFGEFWSVP